MIRRTGYGRIASVPGEDAELTHVTFGTPMGEVLRRYWQPVCLSEEIDELPKLARILGEDSWPSATSAAVPAFSTRIVLTGRIARVRAHRGKFARTEGRRAASSTPRRPSCA